MPPKKKTVRNAYYFFMDKYREDRNRKYPHDPISIKDAASLCSPLWQKMTPEEKKVYEDMAKKEKTRLKGIEVKFTTTGLAVSEVERKEKEHQEYCAQMKADVKQTVESLNLTGLLEKKFYFMHVNYFCQCDDGDYIPAEVGVACFSLKFGVDEFYHTFVAPGNLPIGYTYKAQKHSEDTHGIPIPPSDIGENDFSKIFSDIHAFVQKGSSDGDKPIIYTLNEFEPCVTNFLEKLCYASGCEEKIFRVYDLIQLFFQLRNKSASFSGGEGFPVYCLAENEIENDGFAYTKEICCYWHEGTDSPQYCSLSRARRWGFHIADHCSKDLDVALIPGQHLPSTDKYWNDKPIEDFKFHRTSRRKKVPLQNEASGYADVGAESSSIQPLRQPKSLGIAVAQVLPKGVSSLEVNDQHFPPIGKRIGARFNAP